MKNAGLTIGMCAIGLGLASIGFNLSGNQANATSAHFDAGPAEPTIVWYDSEIYSVSGDYRYFTLMRAWSDGTVEAKSGVWTTQSHPNPCASGNDCTSVGGWVVISSPNEGLNAAADINFDSRVNAEDLGIMLAAWGDAPRNDYPPSDCPLGLLP